MLAALSFADRGLAERLVQGAFQPAQNDQNTQAVDSAPTSAMRDKVMGTIESCRELLATEPPERLEGFWGTVRDLHLRL